MPEAGSNDFLEDGSPCESAVGASPHKGDAGVAAPKWDEFGGISDGNQTLRDPGPQKCFDN